MCVTHICCSLVTLDRLKGNEGIVVQSFEFDLPPRIPVAVLVHEDQHPLSDKTLDDFLDSLCLLY